MELLYIIGVPGVGKTRIVEKLLKGVKGEVMSVPHVTWTHYSDECCQLGYSREVFGGTDALGMASQKYVLTMLRIWQEEGIYNYVLAEGDRLANRKFFNACINMGINLTVVAMVNDKLAQKRRDKRAAILGKEQHERWINSRHTKVENLINDFVRMRWILDPGDSNSAIEQLRTHEVIRQINKAKAAQT